MPRREREAIWKDLPDEHDYPAALSYLTLHFSPVEAADIVDELHSSEIVYFKAKDIFRASGLPLLDTSNKHVLRNVARVMYDEPLSPVLLVRGHPLLIADGYHRVCASYHINEDALIPCKLADV